MARHSSKHTMRWAGVSLTLLACLSAMQAWAEDRPLEYSVKATYLYKLAPYIEWPPAAFPAAATPLRLCIIGSDPFGNIIDRAVEGRAHDDHPIEIQRHATSQTAATCHVAYLGGSSSEAVFEALNRLQGQPVLTVTDAANGRSAKGVIHFVIDGDRVRFEIDNRTATAQGLRISSKLLSLAVSVRR